MAASVVGKWIMAATSQIGHSLEADGAPRVPAASLLSSKRSFAGGIGPGVLVLAACSAFAWWACLRQFGSYDLSPLIDAFWRTRSGQVPGTDFINTFPLIIYLSALLAAVVDLGWTELTLISVLHTAVAFGAIMVLTPGDLRRTNWPLAVAAILALPLVYTNHVWHSSSSQLAGAVALMAFHRAVVEATLSKRTLAGVGLAAALVAVTKQNVALPIIASGLFSVLVIGRAQRGLVAVAMLLGSLLGIGLALVALDMRPQDLLASYTAVAGRTLPTQAMWDEVVSVRSNLLVVALLASALAIMAVRIVVARQALRRSSVALLIMLPATLVPVATDWDTKVNDMVLPLLLICRWAWDDAPGLQQPRRIAAFVLVALVFAVALNKGATRERMETVGAYTFWEPVADRQIETGYFKGMHVGGRFSRVHSEMRQLRRAHPNASIFFGPRLEFGYRLTGAPSPRGMPLWWHPGSSYAESDEDRIIRAFASDRFDLLVFLGKDRTRMPKRLLRLIEARYVRVGSGGELQTFRRK